MMRRNIMASLCVLIVISLTYGIYEKEQIKNHGEIVLLELAPVDPRSLMQGDYMQLRYALEQEIRLVKEPLPAQGMAVIATDENALAHFVRLHHGETLAPTEKLLTFRSQNRRITISPDSFFFQEGHAEAYTQAKYGIFATQGDNMLLIGLADRHKKIISPN